MLQLEHTNVEISFSEKRPLQIDIWTNNGQTRSMTLHVNLKLGFFQQRYNFDLPINNLTYWIVKYLVHLS